MEKQLGKEILSEKDRIAFLMDNCDKVEEIGYTKQFSEEQLSEMKNNLSEIAITINDLEEEKKEAVATFKASIDPLKQEKKTLIDGLKTKATYVRETCYKFIDGEKREVGYYNAQGDLVESRSASADELQTNIFQLTRKAN